jgi:hypothetical protein
VKIKLPNGSTIEIADEPEAEPLKGGPVPDFAADWMAEILEAEKLALTANASTDC